MATSPGEPIPNSFVSGVSRHFEHFQQTKKFPDALFVEVRLADGHAFFCRGLWIAHLEHVPGCVMIHGTPAHAERALVVREQHIIASEFSLKPSGGNSTRKPFGFAAGAQGAAVAAQ